MKRLLANECSYIIINIGVVKTAVGLANVLFSSASFPLKGGVAYGKVWMKGKHFVCYTNLCNIHDMRCESSV